MPNPRLTVRIPPDLDELLPEDGNERSRITIEALRAHLQPQDDSTELTKLRTRMGNLEQLIALLEKEYKRFAEVVRQLQN